MMSSWDDRIKKLEDRDARRSDERETVRSPSHQAAVGLIEEAFSPRNSPSVSPIKGLKSVADERRSLKRGRDQGVVSPPPKARRVSREVTVEKTPNFSGTITSDSYIPSSMNFTPVMVTSGGGLHIRLHRILLFIVLGLLYPHRIITIVIILCCLLSFHPPCLP